MSAWIYILKCADGTYYTGYTTNLERRMNEHSLGKKGSYTYSKLPVKLMYTKQFRIKSRARAFEKQIKGWSRAKKEALINNDKKSLHKLAECKNKTHYKYFGNKINSKESE